MRALAPAGRSPIGSEDLCNRFQLAIECPSVSAEGHSHFGSKVGGVLTEFCMTRSSRNKSKPKPRRHYLLIVLFAAAAVLILLLRMAVFVAGHARHRF
jgi:hypothetical protein